MRIEIKSFCVCYRRIGKDYDRAYRIVCAEAISGDYMGVCQQGNGRGWYESDVGQSVDESLDVSAWWGQ